MIPPPPPPPPPLLHLLILLSSSAVFSLAFSPTCLYLTDALFHLCLYLFFPLRLHTVPTSPPLCLAPESWHTRGCHCVTRAADTSDATVEHVYHCKAL